MSYYLVEFLEDQEWNGVTDDAEFEIYLAEIYPTINGCGQVKSVQRIIETTEQLSFLDFEKLLFLCNNINKISLEKLESLL